MKKFKRLLLPVTIVLLLVSLFSFGQTSDAKAKSAYTPYVAGKQNVNSRNQSLPTGDLSNGADNWYKSDQVVQKKISFKNIYGMNIAGNLFVPKNLDKSAKHSAIIVGAPMGAVKEQSANLYA